MIAGFIGSAGLGAVPGGAGSAPTVQAHTIVFSSVTDTGFTISFTNGDGNGRLVLIKAGGAVDATPADGINYNANSIFGSGDELGTGNFAVYSSSGSSVTVTGLTLNTTYHVRIFEYNQPSFNYLTITTSDNPKSQATLSLPSIQANTISFTNINNTSQTINWIRGNGENALVVVKAGSAVSSNPVDDTTYTANSIFGSGTQIGTGNYVVYKGTGTSVTVTGLTVGVTYHVKIFEFGGGAGAEKYLTVDAYLNPNAEATDYLGATLIDEWISNYGLTLRVNNGDYLEKWKGYRNNVEMNRSGNIPVPVDGILTLNATGTPTLSQSINITGDATFCFLLKKSAMTDSRVTILSAMLDALSLRIDLENSTADEDMAIVLGGVTYLSGAQFTYDSDYHAVCFSISPSAGEFKVFMDGAQVGSTQTIPSTALNWVTANARTWFNFQFVGSVKKIRIYNEAVTPSILNIISDPTKPFASTMVEHRPARCYGDWGQSNEVGSGLVKTDYATELQAVMSTVYYFDTFARYNFEAGVHPVQAGPEIKQMYDLAANYPDDDLFLVKVASANRSLAVDFRSTAPVGTLYTNFVNAYLRMVNTLLAEGRTIIERSFFGMQGEADAEVEAEANEYQTNLTNFNTNFRAATGAVRHVYGRIHSHLPTTGSNARPYANTVRTAQVNVAAADANADYVDTDDNSTGNFELKADSVHFNAIGCTKLGQQRVVKLLGLLPSDYTEWLAITVVDDQPTGDGDFFWHNTEGVGLRASLHYNTAAYSIIGSDFNFYLNPRSDDATPDYRAEIQRRVTVALAVGSREMVGNTYVVPAGGLKPRTGGIGLGQWHTGTGVGGPYPNNFPVVYLEIAKSGVNDKNGDPSQQDELVVVNKVKAFEDTDSGRVNTGIIFSAGAVIHLEQDLISGTGAAGRYRLRVKVGSGSWTTVYDENESTMWANDADGGSVSNVHPYWKLGIYAFGNTTDSAVAANEALNGGAIGSYDVEISIRRVIKTAVLLAADPYYAVDDIINVFDTSV